jgi:hypothetical protein
MQMYIFLINNKKILIYYPLWLVEVYFLYFCNSEFEINEQQSTYEKGNIQFNAFGFSPVDNTT